MFGGDDDLFGFAPDFDGDGDHDLVDFLILDDILTEEENLSSDIDDRDPLFDDEDDWREDAEDGTEYLLDPYDYDTEDEYLEALNEAKYGWREDAEDGLEYGIDPEDYETAEEYEEALNQAKYGWRESVEDGSEYFIDPEAYDTEDDYIQALNEAKYGWREDAEDGSMYDLDPEDFETAEEYEDALEEARRKVADDSITIDIEVDIDDKLATAESVIMGAYVASALGNGTNVDDPIAENTSGKTKYSGITLRKNQAKEKLKDYAQGYTFGVDVPRCKFIINDKSIAARYLTVDGVYLYAQAVKDHFKLPFEIPDETDSIETYFETLLQDLVEHNVVQAMCIWEWCLDTFMPYIQYEDYKNNLTHGILLDMGNFIDEFPSHIVDYMVKRPTFIEKLIQQCTDSLWCIEDFVIIAIKAGHIETAKRIMECAFNNPHTTVADKARFIKSCIDECSNWEELDTMEAFQNHVFPIVFTQTDVRIKNKISHWQKQMSEYIAEIEKSSDLYLYSRSNAWREKYKDADESPIGYDSEEEYLRVIEARKYRWRDYCSIRYGINPNDYDTRAEYDAAVRTEVEKQQAARQKERDETLTDTTLYKFCKVSVNYPERPHYYYLSGELELKVGDHVKVPFGQNNDIADGVVMSVGECYGSSFPCPISKLKKVMKKA